MNNSSWNVGKRGQKIGQQPLAEGIVFHDSPEKQIFVDLVGVSAPDNRVVILFL